MIACAKKIACLILFIGLTIPYLNGQVAPFAFNHFTLDNNLFAHTLMRDSKGYLWIGSDGLFRYDGINTKHFVHDPKNSHSLVSNIIKNIAEDKKGHIWIGTLKGISCYDPTTDSFENYEYEDNDPKLLRLRLDNILFVDKGDTIWCGNRSGLSRYDDQSKNFISYNLSKYQLPGHNRGSFITGIIEDKKSKGWFWLSSYDGLIHFNKKTGFARYYYPSGPPLTINSLFQDSHEKLWLATWGRGLGFFEEVAGHFSFFPFEKNAHFGSDNIVFNLQEHIINKDSSLFFISTNKGLGILNLYDQHKVNYSFFYLHQPDDIESIGGIPSETLIDMQGIIWVATGNDISYILPATQVFHHAKSTGSADILINNITGEKQDDGKYQYWLSCWYANRLILCDGNFLPKKDVKLPAGYGQSANSWQINQLLIDTATNNMWLATMDGLYKWERTHQTIKIFRGDNSSPNSLASEQIMCILMDQQNRLWIGTYRNGIYMLNTNDNSFIKLPTQITNAFKDKRILCMYEDSKQRIWVGSSNGLLKFNKNGT
jgi:ligand-binding sensor domain-containing protein